MRIQAVNPYTKNKYYLQVQSKSELLTLLRSINKVENQFFIFEKFQTKELVHIHGSELKKCIFSIV